MSNNTNESFGSTFNSSETKGEEVVAVDVNTLKLVKCNICKAEFLSSTGKCDSCGVIGKDIKWSKRHLDETVDTLAKYFKAFTTRYGVRKMEDIQILTTRGWRSVNVPDFTVLVLVVLYVVTRKLMLKQRMKVAGCVLSTECREQIIGKII